MFNKDDEYPEADWGSKREDVLTLNVALLPKGMKIIKPIRLGLNESADRFTLICSLKEKKSLV